MLDETDMRFAIDDARIRHRALIDLINGTSDQALKLLGMYVTLGLAAASGGVAGLSNATNIPAPVTIGLLCILIPLFVGSLFCFQTIKSAPVNLPGRDPEFWLWAARPDVKREMIFNAYLENLNEKVAANRKLNDETANALRNAKRCGVVSPIVAVLAGSATILALRFHFI